MKHKHKVIKKSYRRIKNKDYEWNKEQQKEQIEKVKIKLMRKKFRLDKKNLWKQRGKTMG